MLARCHAKPAGIFASGARSPPLWVPGTSPVFGSGVFMWHMNVCAILGAHRHKPSASFRRQSGRSLPSVRALEAEDERRDAKEGRKHILVVHGAHAPAGPAGAATHAPAGPAGAATGHRQQALPVVVPRWLPAG